MSVSAAWTGPTLIFSASSLDLLGFQLEGGDEGFGRVADSQATGSAMQRSPAEPNAPEEICEAANAVLASGMTMAWLFAPPRACARLPFATALIWTYIAMGVEPMNNNSAIPSFSRIASTAQGSGKVAVEGVSGGDTPVWV